jgi:hypothetical protein
VISIIRTIVEDLKDPVSTIFKTYECVMLIKCVKKYNKKDILERIRGIKNITIVQTTLPDKTDAINQKQLKYEYSYLKIKFNTNREPEDELKIITDKMVHSDISNGDANIAGLVSSKPIPSTIKQED